MDRLKRVERDLAGVEEFLRQKMQVYRKSVPALSEEYRTQILVVRQARDDLRIECRERRTKEAQTA